MAGFYCVRRKIGNEPHAAEHDVARAESSPFGTRYVVEGIMNAPDGRAPLIRSIWFIERAETIPRFVSAYPLKRRSG